MKKGEKEGDSSWVGGGVLLCALLFAGVLIAGASAAQETGEAASGLSQEARAAAIARLSPKHKSWLQSVLGLISQYELDYFVMLPEDFRRDAFMAAFWGPRDPDPETRVNELEARWQQLKGSSGRIPYSDPRFLLLLFNGPPGGWSLPDGRPVGRCFSRALELEIWFYEDSERVDRKFPVILQRRATGSPYEVYLPGDSVRPVQRTGGLPLTDIRVLCAEELLRYAINEIYLVADYDGALRRALSPTLPSPEWLATFASAATDLPPGAETFEVSLVSLDFPSRRRSRTAVELMLAVPRSAAPGRRFDGELYHNIQLVGEVIRDGQLFEGFRYGFEGPTPEEVVRIPLGFTRYLRPGPASLRILLEDVYTGRFARLVREINVPAPDGLPGPVTVTLAAPDSASALRLVPPAGSVHTGLVRFRARAMRQLEKVTFYLDGEPRLSKRRPPFSVELDLGPSPVPHRVRVVGFAEGREVATDQIWINQGAPRFRVRLVEPRAGGIYPGSLTARVEVETPDGLPPESLELYLNDEPVASFAEPPYTQTLRLAGSEVAVVRAVAHLADGSTSEDAVIVNASAFTEAIEVRLVELHAVVVGSAGELIRGLSQEQFRVFEDGVPQTLQRFQPASEAAISAALLIDRSASMEPHLAEVADAARGFAGAAASSAEDRIAVLSFADRLSIDAGFEASSGALERALAGLDAVGGTALYDSLVQALNTFEGVRGPTALLLFTDGQDEGSRLSFEQTLESARRAGVGLYAIGLAAAFPEKAQRKLLRELAEETGGRAVFLAGLDELAAVYAAILEELRSRYLLAYQPAGGKPAAELRQLRVEVEVRGAEVRARRGYYP